jgi:hypothetical protein
MRDRGVAAPGEDDERIAIAIAAAAGWHTTVIIGRTGSPPIEEERQREQHWSVVTG